MGDPKIGSYKSSTFLRAICFFGIGFQISLFVQTKTWSVEELVIIAVLIFGIFASRAKNGSQLKIVGGLAVLVGVVRAFFEITFYSKVRTLDSANRLANDGSGVNLVAFNGFSEVTLVGLIQLITFAIVAYLAFSMSK
jgi:hypothetical protein